MSSNENIPLVHAVKIKQSNFCLGLREEFLSVTYQFATLVHLQQSGGTYLHKEAVEHHCSLQRLLRNGHVSSFSARLYE